MRVFYLHHNTKVKAGFLFNPLFLKQGGLFARQAFALFSVYSQNLS
jgi:hypothetical protein